MDYELKLQTWGNSQGVRIPAPLMRELGLGKHAALTARVKGGKLIIGPAAPKRLTLAAMLAQLPPDPQGAPANPLASASLQQAGG